MTNRAARWVFWVGTLVSAGLFLALTVDTTARFAALTHADRLDDQVVAGKRVFEERNCNDCHTVLGFGSYYAPDLTRAYGRIGEAGIARRLEHPEVVFAGSMRKMPQQHLTAREISDLTAYLRWISGIDNHDWPPQDSPNRFRATTDRLMAAGLSPSAALIDQQNCLTCHALGSRGQATGPRLEWIGARRGAVWIAQYLADPDKMSPGAQMPAYPDLTREQREQIGEFILAAASNARGGER